MVKLGHGWMVTWWNGMGPRYGSSNCGASQIVWVCVVPWNIHEMIKGKRTRSWFIINKSSTHIVELLCFWPPRVVWYDTILTSSGVKSALRGQCGEEFPVMDKHNTSDDHVSSFPDYAFIEGSWFRCTFFYMVVFMLCHVHFILLIFCVYLAMNWPVNIFDVTEDTHLFSNFQIPSLMFD